MRWACDRAHWSRTLADAQGMRTLLLGETRNNRIPARLPAGTAVAHKTGDLAGISNDAGVVYASTGPITLVILAHDVPGHGRAEATAAEIAAMVVGAYDPQLVQGSSPPVKRLTVGGSGQLRFKAAPLSGQGDRDLHAPLRHSREGGNLPHRHLPPDPPTPGRPTTTGTTAAGGRAI